MNTIILIGTVALAHLLAAISPGPDFIMIVKNSLTYSRKTGIWTAVGLGLGMATHITYCILGLAFIISQSILAFSIIKLLGASYLIYVGLKSLFSKSTEIKITEQEQVADISALKAIRIGYLTNILNPKVTLFFLGLFTLIISPSTPAYVLIIVTLLIITDTILWFSLVATIMTQVKIRLAFKKFQNIFHKVFGGLLILIGLKLALAKR